MSGYFAAVVIAHSVQLVDLAATCLFIFLLISRQVVTDVQSLHREAYHVADLIKVLSVPAKTLKVQDKNLGRSLYLDRLCRLALYVTMRTLPGVVLAQSLWLHKLSEALVK